MQTKRFYVTEQLIDPRGDHAVRNEKAAYVRDVEKAGLQDATEGDVRYPS